MKLHRATAVALLFLTSCGPDVATINQATERAEAAAQRAQAVSLKAEDAAKIAELAAERTKSADFGVYPNGEVAYFSESSAEGSAMRAQEVIERFCCCICDSCQVGLSSKQKKEFWRQQEIRAKACNDPGTVPH